MAQVVESDGGFGLIDIQQIVGYISENSHDPVVKFIYIKEIAKKILHLPNT